MWFLAILFWIPIILICFFFQPVLTVLAVLFLGAILFTALALS